MCKCFLIIYSFVTTILAGEETGLALSLNYYIVTKDHTEEVKVKTMEREYAEFLKQLPVNKITS